MLDVECSMLDVAVDIMNIPLLALTVRSLREDARAVKTHLVRAGLVLAMLMALWMANAEMASGIGAPGLRFFSITVWVNLMLMTFLGVGVFATSITEEKEAGSLGLLKL